jgi:mRNA interferase MazF
LKPAAGQIVLFKFTQTDNASGKLRPALLLGKLPGRHGDLLICMISSQIHQFIEDFDEIVSEDSEDFVLTGLKTASVIRVGRLAVVDGAILIGSIGEIDPSRLERIKKKLADWLIGA